MKIHKVNKTTDYKYLNMFEISYTDKLGASRMWQAACRGDQPRCVSGKFNIPDAVIIVPFHTTREKLIIIKEFRITLNDYHYGFPAGLVDKGETIEETSRRELVEETGLHITAFKKISPPVYASAGMTDESFSIVYVECEGEPSKEGNQSTEDITTMFISPSEALEICNNPDLKTDAKAWLILSSYVEKGQI